MSISHFWSNKKCCTAEQAVQHFLLVFFFYFGKTALADIFSLEEYDIVCIAAEYAGAGWFIFSQDDPILIRINLKCIPFSNSEGPAQLNRYDNASEFVYLSNDSSGFHFIPPL